MINKIYEWFLWIRKPMIEQTLQEEILGLLMIAGIGLLIWLIGEIIYSIELKYEQRKHTTK